MKIYTYLSCIYEAIEKKEINFLEINLPAGEILFLQKAIKEDDLVLVLQGLLRLTRKGLEGDLFIEAGELLGDITAFTGHSRSASVKAVKPCVVACFNKNDFVRLLAKPNAHGEYSCLSSYLEFMADRLVRNEDNFKEQFELAKSGKRLRNMG